MRGDGTGTDRWGVAVAAATLVALGAKLVVSWHAHGTLDVGYFEGFLDRIQHVGGSRIYRHVEIFNHPPFMIHLLRAIGALSSWSGLPFGFCLRLPGIVADLVTVALVWRLRDRLAAAPLHPLAIVALAFAPASLLISGYHGNTDSLMIGFVVLAVFLMERRASTWPAGVALGMALNIKIVAIIFAPALLLYRTGLTRRAAFALAAGATFVVGSMPFLWQDGRFILQQVFGYASMPGTWGAPLLLRLLRERLEVHVLASDHWSTVPGAVDAYALTVAAYAAYVRWGRIPLLAAVCLAALGMNRAGRRWPLFAQCGVIASLFLLLTPGFGVQYLAWVVPWTAAATLLAAGLFHFASGALLYLMYSTNFLWDARAQERSVECWAVLGLVLLDLRRRHRRATAAAEARRPRRLAITAGALALLAAAFATLWLSGFESRPVVVASSTLGPAFPPAGAIDGRRDAAAWSDRGGWNSAGTPRPEAPESLIFVFLRPRRIERLDLFAYPDPQFTLRSFVFQYAAPRRWVDIEQTRIEGNSDSSSWRFDFPPVTTQVVRLQISAAADQYARVVEVEFGPSGTQD